MVKQSGLRLGLGIALVSIVIPVIPTPVIAGEVNVAWGASSGATGYRLHRGTSSGQYSGVADVGNTTSTSADGLEDCKMWYFAVTAYNSAGESGFSSEVLSWPRAVLDAASPATAEQGTGATVAVTGINFRDGDVVTISNPGVHVDSVSVTSCSQITLAVTVDANAPVGAADIAIIHPSGVKGTGFGLFNVISAAIPTVVGATPGDGTTDVPVSVQPTVEFSEAVTGVTSNNVRLLDEGGAAVPQASNSPVMSSGATVATIVPADPLAHGAGYRIQVLGGTSGIQDTDGNTMSGDFLQANGFTTETDDTPPAIDDLIVGEITATSAVVSWSTDQPADSQVFYRKQGDDVYQIEEDTDLVTEHAVSLTGLEPATEYEFHVASTNDAGLTSTSPDETFATDSSPYDYLRFEAESGVLVSPVRTDEGSGAFAGMWIESPPGGQPGSPDEPRGTATYGVHVPEAGTWRLWVRMEGNNNGSNSWFESIDGATLEPISTTVHGEWSWVAGRSYVLNAGLHVVQLGGYEPGARADRLILTDDPDFEPSEQPGVDDTPPGPVSELVASGGSSQILLSWTNPSNSDLARVIVRYRTDGQFPMSPVDGFPLVDEPAAPGGSGSYTHSGVDEGVSYFYGVFTVDESDNASNPAHVIGTTDGGPQPPPPPTGLVVH